MKPGDFSTLFMKNNVGVLVPTYNNALTLGDVVSNVLEFTDQVVVVNDGCTDSTLQILEKFPQINLVNYPANQGKGYALRMGFQRARELGYSYVISIDSDGQHFAEDLPKFVKKLEDHPNSIIMGVRNMEQSSVPGKSSFGHKFSNFWFWFETGLKIGDTQSGYRLYPLRPLQEIKFLTRKFEFEIEVLVRSAWRGIPIVEVPVRVFYAEKGKRISHFRPFTDFTRISILNTFLVTIAIVYIKPRDLFRRIRKSKFGRVLREQLVHPGEPDWLKALSVGFGIFMGIIPLWGFQLIIAIALSFVFRLNKALVIIAANISIPPMIPLILFISYLTGALWMGDHAQYVSFSDKITFESVQNNSLQYVYGAITLALLSGIVFAGLTSLVLKSYRRLKSET